MADLRAGLGWRPALVSGVLMVQPQPLFLHHQPGFAAALFAALGMLVAGPPSLVLVGSASAGPEYTFQEQFAVPDSENEQGLAWADSRFYVGFDVGGGKGRIAEYDGGGAEVRRTGPLPLGHTSELSFRQADGNLYVATGGRSPTTVSVVDMRRSPPSVLRTYDFSSLGVNGMVAVDNTQDRMLVFAGPTGGPYTFAFTDMSGRISSRFTAKASGLPQGLEVAHQRVLLYTSAPGMTSNTITEYTPTGAVDSTITMPVAVEGEGLAVDPQTNEIFAGVHYPNRVYRMTPVLFPPVGNNLLANHNAESGSASSSSGTQAPIPSWQVSGGMTAVRYGAPGYPTASSPGPSSRGALLFTGGVAATSTLTQHLDVTTAATAIDTGALRYHLSGWLGGYLTQADNATVDVSFTSASGGRLGGTELGPVTAADRGGHTGLLQRTAVGPVPAGTRSMTVTVTCTRFSGTHNDGYADNLTLVLSPT